MNTELEYGFAGISDFNQYGQGWEWVAVFNEYSNWTHSMQQVVRTFSTNQHGNGLWIDGKQVRGTAQFSMSYNRKNASAKAKRMMERGDW
jgi:hypothetical protein